jgi:anti-anti-sigma factor
VDNPDLDHFAVIALADEIDVTNAADIREQLRSAVAAGVKVVIADMTGTAFCDTSCFRNLLIASDHASASGAQLRLVIRAAAVWRVMTALGFDRLLRVYPSLEAARADHGSRRQPAREPAAEHPAGRPRNSSQLGESPARVLAQRCSARRD